MNTATRAHETLDELLAELGHADDLITEQQARIETLERQVRLLQVLLDAAEGAA
jgi:hypothetical protein